MYQASNECCVVEETFGKSLCVSSEQWMMCGEGDLWYEPVCIKRAVDAVWWGRALVRACVYQARSECTVSSEGNTEGNSEGTAEAQQWQ